MKFPNKLLRQFQAKLLRQQKLTEKQLKSVAAEDPFADPDRTIDNAASDTDVKEEVGHDRVEAIKRELVQKLSHIKRALRWLRRGGYGKCEQCGQPIDEKRLKVVPTATFCVNCERKREGSNHR